MKSQKESPIYLFQFEYLNRNELEPEYYEFYLRKIQYALLCRNNLIDTFDSKVLK